MSATVTSTTPLNHAYSDPESAHYYQRKSLGWLTSFNTALDLDGPSTWTGGNLPVQSKVNTFHGYSVTHEKFMWEVRMEPTILEDGALTSYSFPLMR
ncbi:uncharacterized protein N7515_009752 [Penicillium bovifimosum]|uniref:Uncharacterized protein n=1 Tax=Penicillium bovifimosum TaxID=126998 RepID=A0A9W9GHH8_9EURO|nr:uncharacterized protein N7515_009752 [Penicillium bovifimosum]KAJ5120364.1 hypothetical protein N7515_009752 [Penicillium bovifimosum]